MRVGLNKLASPFTPAFTFELLFVRVFGELNIFRSIIDILMIFHKNYFLKKHASIYDTRFYNIPVANFYSVKKAACFC